MKEEDALVIEACLLRSKWQRRRTRERLANDCAALYVVARQVARGAKINKGEFKKMLAQVAED